jgi:diguanylate cyclase (GGDEF)-like protein
MNNHISTTPNVSAVSRTSSSLRLRSRIFLPVLIAAAAAIFAAVIGLYHATARGDAIAVERQLKETRLAISNSLDELALNQEVVSIWDDPVLKLRESELDWTWLDENIGVWLHDLFGHDQVYVLNADESPVYSVVDGVRVDPQRYAEVSGGLEHLVGTARGRLTDDSNEHERLPNRPLHPSTAVKTSEKAIHATGLVNLGGRPAAASVMRIIPASDHIPRSAETDPLLVSVRFLDESFLRELAKRNLIDSPRFSQSLHLSSGEHAWLLTSEHGTPLGHFIWRPELPGTAIMRSVAPTAALAIGIVIVIMGLLANWLYWSMREQRKTIVELQASEAQAQHLAFHDPLTGLPNRAKFNNRLEKELARASDGSPIAILLLDLDRFKHVNDTLGHLAGDALIRQFGSRLLHLVGDQDTVARLGGDEFVILLRDASTFENVEALCRRILEAVRQPFELLGNSAFVGVSIGVTIAPDAGSERIDLMRKADIALYRAKADGRDCYCVFSPVMDDSVRLRSTIEEDLRAALAAGNGLQVHYQPQVAGADSTIVGLEALVRWQHPTLGLVAPDQFIGVAEGSGLIKQLGEWVLRQACAASRRWPDLFVAVNLSPAQFRTNGFAEQVIAIVRECGADPHRIELEVTEGVLLDDSDTVREALSTLREAGFKIALDDFGTGYSSLSYLRRFEVDKIKIDRSFVQHLGHAVDSAAIISAVLTLGHAMGLNVTAEGVETTEQHDFLEAAGCHTMQGYLFSRPLPQNEIDRLLANTRQMRGAA